MALASLILRGGKVASPGAPGGFAEAIAIDNDTILAVGNNDEIDALAGPSTRVVDLAGRLAVPAFGDGHVHAVGVERSAGVGRQGERRQLLVGENVEWRQRVGRWWRRSAHGVLLTFVATR